MSNHFVPSLPRHSRRLSFARQCAVRLLSTFQKAASTFAVSIVLIGAATHIAELDAQVAIFRAVGVAADPIAPPSGATSAPPKLAPVFDPTKPMISLVDGGMASGTLLDSDDPKTLRWQSLSFVTPFEFDIGYVNAVHFPAPAQPIKPTGEMCFELSSGDVLFGTLLSLNGDAAEIDAPPFGRLRVERQRIERVYRWKDRADLVYMGPNGIAEWNGAQGWVEEAGQLFTETAGAEFAGNIMPPQAEIELALSWKKRPQFSLSLGSGKAERVLQQAFRLEGWGEDLVLARENPKEAELALIQKITDGPGRIHLRIFLDQKSGRCLVYSREGERVADLTVASKKPEIHEGLRLLNKQGDLRLERLRIGRWNGDPPENVTAAKSRVHRVDGSVVYGEVVGFDAAQKTFTLRNGEMESQIAADQVATMFLSAQAAGEPAQIRLVHQDGSQLSGELVKVADGAVSITTPGIAEPIQLPIKDLRAIVALRNTDIHLKNEPALGQQGRLELDGLRLNGKLVAGQEQDSASCLVWQPTRSVTSSAMLKTAAGRIVYRDPPPPPTVNQLTAQQQRRQQQVERARALVAAAKPKPQPKPAPAGLMGNLLGALAGAPPRVAVPQAEKQAEAARRNMHLRTGDIVPCEVTSIDEQGVHFRTPLSDASFMEHDKIQAIELTKAVAGPVRLNKGKRDRLLTLPRMQKENPPTHLIRSHNGDYLRGAVTGMDDKSLQVEIHLESKQLPLDRVSQIIWLHPDDLTPKPAADPGAAVITRVQALRSDGVRMTFFPSRFADDVLSGTSEILGTAHVNLKDVDQLAIGPAIELHAARLAFQQWRLQNAIEPKILSSDGGEPGGDSAAADSALVNKPAPDFSLELLDGKNFKLSDAKGKIVVLDFFASWCGPCLQTMPQIEKVAADFAGEDVMVLAVNLEEAPQTVTAMFERHKLTMPVAMDRDGAVSARYGVTSIPQTIVIDREGKVVRHYIGSSGKLGEEVTAVLQDLLKPAAPAAGQ